MIPVKILISNWNTFNIDFFDNRQNENCWNNMFCKLHQYSICSSGLLHTFWHSMIVHAIATTQKTTSTTFTKNQQTPKHVETQSTSSSISHHFSRSFRTGHHFPRVLTRRCEAKFIKSSGWKTLIENEDWGKKFSERWTRIVWGGK